MDPSAIPRTVWPRVRGGGGAFRRAVLPVVGFWTAFGLLRCGLWWAIDPSRYSPVVEPWLFFHSMLRAWFWAALTGAIWQLCRLVPWRPGRAPLLILVHAAGATAAAFLDSVWFRATIVALRPGITLRPFAGRFLIDYTGNAFLYLAVAAVATARRHHAVLDECRLHALRAKTRSTAARLHVLGRQLQPHFLCNALNAIAELVHGDLERARRTLGQLRALLLGPLSSPAAEVPLSEELAQVEPYLAIQRIRFGERLTVTIDVAPEALPLYVPSFLLQPLVENAIRHGVGKRAGPGHVAVAAVAAGGQLTIVVRDDGPGPGGGSVREGVGLRNTRLRLGELHGDDAGVELRPGPTGGAETVVFLPARSASRLAADSAAVEPTLPPLPTPARPRNVVGAIVLGWAALGLFWSGLGALLSPYLARPVGFTAGLAGSMAAAAVFALATLGLVQASRVWPLDRPSRLALHLGLLAAAVCMIPLARWLIVFGWQLPPIDENMAANLQLDISVCVVVTAGAHATLYLRRARERVLEAARHEDELVTARLEAQRLKLDPPALAAALDGIGEVAAHDVERADELAARLGEDLRATFLGDAPA